MAISLILMSVFTPFSRRTIGAGNELAVRQGLSWFDKILHSL